jgi:hypothetical protein
MNYFTDVYGFYASSAIAAQVLLRFVDRFIGIILVRAKLTTHTDRNTFGGVFPLFGEQMYHKLGIIGVSIVKCFFLVTAYR